MNTTYRINANLPESFPVPMLTLFDTYKGYTIQTNHKTTEISTALIYDSSENLIKCVHVEHATLEKRDATSKAKTYIDSLITA